MKDFSVLILEEDDKITLGLGEDATLYETIDPSKRLLQKIIVALKQEPGSNAVNPDGYSLSNIIGRKIGISEIDEIKVKIHMLIEKLQNAIVAEQEISPDDSLEGMLEKITTADISTDEEAQEWHIALIVFDKAGGKTYLRV